MGSDQRNPSKQTYDALGRPYQHYDARQETAREEDQFKDNVTEIQYNDRGYAHRWVDGVYVEGKPRRTYRTIESLDARGNVTKETLGGGVVTTQRRHDEKTGRITGITSRDAMTRPVQAETYTWDILGNLTGRTAQSGNNTLNETFAYDTLNRLTQADTVHKERDPLTQQVTGTHTLTPQSVTYDAHGNITNKSDVGDYTYDTRHPHAVSQTKQDGKAATRYYYDQQGNLIGDNRQRRLTYTPFNKVARITRNTTAHIIDFAYGPDRARFLRIDTSNTNLGTSTTTTVYLGNVEHVIAGDKSSTYKRYLAGGSVLIIQDYDKHHMRTGEDTRYLLKDHLGSIARILDKHGTLDQSFSYDAWGQRRNPDTAAMLASLTLTSPIHTGTTTRGYTGHEMLDAVGIIHMNGRIYDAKLGRFLQADPVIQFPDYTQSWNSYSYVLNNPLAYTDPSGYILGAVGGILGGVVGFIACGPGCAVKGAAIGAGLGTSADVLRRGGSLGQALLAGVSAAAFTFAAGGLFPGVDATFGQVLLYGLQMGVIGGITTTLQGGNFGNGFLVAGTAALVGGALARSGWFQGLTKAGKFVTSSVVGGTVSRITGGKFANGALTSAFAFLVNSAAQAARELTPQEKTYARMSRDVYDLTQADVDSGYQIDDYTLTELAEHRSGLKAALFVNGDARVVAFAGTNPGSFANWKANLLQAFGFESTHYNAGFEFAQRFGGNVHYTGHSLGGGIAAAVAIRSGVSATVFNAAGVHINTLGGVLPANGSVVHFHSSFDVLQLVNTFSPASVPGRQVPLGAAGFHGMGGVCRAVGC